MKVSRLQQKHYNNIYVKEFRSAIVGAEDPTHQHAITVQIEAAPTSMLMNEGKEINYRSIQKLRQFPICHKTFKIDHPILCTTMQIYHKFALEMCGRKSCEY